MVVEKSEPVDDVLRVFKNNLLLQYCLITPFVALFVWLFGFYSCWGTLVVAALGYSIRVVAVRKARFYQKFNREVPLTRNKPEIQHCHWLNLIIRKYWISCVPKFVEPEIAKVNVMLDEKKPGFIKKLEISKWNLGDRAIRITQIYTPIILSDDRYELEMEIVFAPDIEVTVQAAAVVPLTIVTGEIKFKGRMKFIFDFNDLFPECSVISIGFTEQPLIEVAVRPVAFFDILSAPIIYDILNEVMQSQIEPMLVYPNKLQFTLGGGQVETYDTMLQPITDIIIIHSDTAKAPGGYVLLQRTAAGMLPANLNTGNKGKQMYICYSRDPTKKPITGLCILYPEFDVKPPHGYEAIEETPAAESASLNTGNDGPETLLCFTREKSDTPITGLAIVNKSEDYILNEGFVELELSPTGERANLNKGTSGDPLFLAYNGGCGNFFGFEKEVSDPECGILHLEIKEGRDLIAADLGGTSDPFCEFFIGSAPTKTTASQFTGVKEKTLAPFWGETLVFKDVKRNDILTINVYDKDAISIAPELLGRIQISMEHLVATKSVDQWIDLQMVPNGQIRIVATALDFGLPADTEPKDFVPLKVNEYNTDGAIFGGLSAVGGFGIAGIKGVGNFGANLGGMGMKGVTNVGDLGLKGVTGAVGGVGAVGGAAAGAVGGAVGNVTGAVGGLFGRKKSKKSAKSEEEKSTESTLIEDTTPCDPIFKEGDLDKVSGGLGKISGFGKSHKRYCVLEATKFLVYKSLKDKKAGKAPQDTYNLIECSLNDIKELTFDLDCHGDHTFKCTEASEVQMWTDAINNNIRHSKQQ